MRSWTFPTRPSPGRFEQGMSDRRASNPDLPTLSVVVPNYNHARYLEAALQGHLEQTIAPLEILVVDDGSTDDSCAIVERVAGEHSGVRLIRLAKNRGVNAAMTHGLQEARGDYVCFSAADDMVTREFAGRSLEVLARHPAAGFSFSDLAVSIGDSGVVRQFPLFLSDRPCMLSPGDLERLLMRNYFNFPSHTIVYRRDALLALGGFMEDLLWLADWFVNYALAFRHGACYVPQVLAFFRLTPDSYSARGPRQAGAQRDLVYRMVDLLGSSTLQDVAGAFRRSAVLPEFRLRVLVWLLASPRHRSYLTRRLVFRLLVRSVWGALIAYVPDRLRRAIRWLASRPTRRRLAGRWSFPSGVSGRQA